MQNLDLTKLDVYKQYEAGYKFPKGCSQYNQQIEVDMLNNDEEWLVKGKIGNGSKLVLKLRWRPYYKF